jgi:membrane protein YqaA with SNARE-associated domain
LWEVAGVSFLGAVVLPLPGATSAALFSMRANLVLGSFAVIGAAIGGTVGGALLLAGGEAGRRAMARRVRHEAWARRWMEWSDRLVRHWTYLGVAALLVPPFVPRVAVLYPAISLRLKPLPFVVAVFAGTLARNLIVLVTVMTISGGRA